VGRAGGHHATVAEEGASGPTDAAGAAAPVLIARTSGYTSRFVIAYIVLAAILVSAVTGAVVLALQKGPPKPLPWSVWRPAKGDSAKVTGEIISHVSRQYKVNQAGDQLVVVLPSAPEVHQNTKNFSVSTIAIRASATSQNLTRIIPTRGMLQQQFCGLGSSCSIARGTATATRERLLRREALEIALYTFKFEPSVNALVTYMPPPPGQPPETILFLERSAFKQQLSDPIRKTLPLSTPPLPSDPDPKESTTIDRLTLPSEYLFQYQELSDKTQALILAPSSS
jgi:hypothetical protein